MKHALLWMAVGLWSSCTWALTCPQGQPARVAGDAPGAISYDIYRQMRPLSAERLARLTEAQQVRMIPDGTWVCTIADDGVADPRAVLIGGPRGQMNYWVSQRNLDTADSSGTAD